MKVYKRKLTYIPGPGITVPVQFSRVILGHLGIALRFNFALPLLLNCVIRLGAE